jgi:hypothetical protein
VRRRHLGAQDFHPKRSKVPSLVASFTRVHEEQKSRCFRKDAWQSYYDKTLPERKAHNFAAGKVGILTAMRGEEPLRQVGGCIAR